MEKEELFDLIPFYLSGKLTPEESELFRNELTVNKELQKEVQFWKATKKATILHAKLTEAQHPSIDELTAYVRGGIDSQSIRWVQIDKHVSECTLCNDDAQSIRKLYPRDGLFQRLKFQIVDFAGDTQVFLFNIFQPLWQQPMRLAYVSATLIVLVVGVLYLPQLLWQESPRNMITMSYSSVNRSRGFAYESFALLKGENRIMFNISVPRIVGSTDTYAYTIIGDSGKTVLVNRTEIHPNDTNEIPAVLQFEVDWQMLRGHEPFILYIVNTLSNGQEATYDFPFIFTEN